MDDRRIVIAAPPPGQPLKPPPRKASVVVAPQVPAQPPQLPVASPDPAPIPGASVYTDHVHIPAPTPTAQHNEPAVPAAPKTSPRAAQRAPTPPRRWNPRRVATAVGVVLALLITSTMVWGYTQFRAIERIDLSDVLASRDGTNYLFVGSDSRAGVDPNDPNADAILGDDSTSGPERSDTILIMRVTGSGTQMLSVPRDLYVTIAETGERQRINAAFNGGPGRLIATLEAELGLPIHHYIQVDFVAFGEVVDAVGGITVDFPNPVVDGNSGLNIPEAGRVRLDGTQALAYVRARHYTEVIDGRRVPDVRGDLGRIERQQVFLAAIMHKIGGSRNPLALRRISQSLVGGLVIDDDLGFFTALGLLRRMRSIDPEPASLPVSNFTTGNGAQVLRLVQPGADEVLRQFGSDGAVPR